MAPTVYQESPRNESNMSCPGHRITPQLHGEEADTEKALGPGNRGSESKTKMLAALPVRPTCSEESEHTSHIMRIALATLDRNGRAEASAALSARDSLVLKTESESESLPLSSSSPKPLTCQRKQCECNYGAGTIRSETKNQRLRTVKPGI
jgi:hypothetical protein